MEAPSPAPPPEEENNAVVVVRCQEEAAFQISFSFIPEPVQSATYNSPQPRSKDQSKE